MDDHWASETGLETLFLPNVVIFVHFVLNEDLLCKLLLYLALLLIVGMSLLVSSVLSLVLQVESNRLLEIALNGTTLMMSAQSVVDLDVDLGTVEGTISVVEGPGSSKLVKSLGKSGLSLVPLIVGAETLLGSGGELHLESESENAVGVVKEVKNVSNLISDLIIGAENVSIVLLETTDTGEAGKGTGNLVSVQHTEISEPDWHVSVGSDVVIEHEAMSRAIHWLHTETVTLNLPHEHVIFVGLVVT